MKRPVSRRVYAALVSDRWFKRVTRIMRATHEGWWLGIMDADDLAAANSAAYSRWARFKDASYNRSGLRDWEQDAVRKHFRDGASVLVASAGAARELIGLNELGYTVTGFDPSTELVKAGREFLAEDGLSIELLTSPPDRIPQQITGKFDGVIIGWVGYVHIRETSARIDFLQELRSLVDPGAPLLLSFFLRSRSDRHFATVERIAVTIRQLRRSPDTVERGDTVAGTFDHYSTWDEIETEARAGGFEIVDSSSSPVPHVVCRAV